MNVAELERLAGGDQPMGAMDCEEVIKHLARRVIASEQLVGAIKDMMHFEIAHVGPYATQKTIAVRNALTAYEATK